MCFTILEKEETTLLDYKNRKLKKAKNWDFSEGVSPWFGQKLEIFQDFYFKENRPEK